MIDFGNYEIIYDENTKEFIAHEQLEGKERKFKSIVEMIDFIKNDLENVERDVKKC